MNELTLKQSSHKTVRGFPCVQTVGKSLGKACQKMDISTLSCFTDKYIVSVVISCKDIMNHVIDQQSGSIPVNSAAWKEKAE